MIIDHKPKTVDQRLKKEKYRDSGMAHVISNKLIFNVFVPPLCKGRLGGVDIALPPLTPPYKGGEARIEWHPACTYKNW